MAENILDYIESVEEDKSEDACFTQSDTITVEGSVNEFRSSEAEFTCWRKGDLFIVRGTDYNDGLYEKANEAHAYHLKARSAISGETISLVSENCRGKIVAFNEAEYGGGSMVPASATSTGDGDIGSKGEGSVTALAPTAYGIGCTSCTAADSYGIGEPTAQNAEIDASGTTVITGDGSITVPNAWGQFYALGDMAPPAPWVSAAAEEYVGGTFWGRAAITVPNALAGNYSDASATASNAQISASIVEENYGKLHPSAPRVIGWSIDDNASIFAPNPTISAYGASGAQGTCLVPNAIVEAHLGGAGRISVPNPTVRALSGFPDRYMADGDVEVPNAEISGEINVPIEPETGDASITAWPPTMSATGECQIAGSASITVSTAYITAVAVTKRVGDGDSTIANATVSAEAVAAAVGDGNVAIANAIIGATALPPSRGSVLLSYQEHGKNWAWQN